MTERSCLCGLSFGSLTWPETILHKTTSHKPLLVSILFNKESLLGSLDILVLCVYFHKKGMNPGIPLWIIGQSICYCLEKKQYKTMPYDKYETTDTCTNIYTHTSQRNCYRNLKPNYKPYVCAGWRLSASHFDGRSAKQSAHLGQRHHGIVVIDSIFHQQAIRFCLLTKNSRRQVVPVNKIAYSAIDTFPMSMFIRR